MVYEILEARGVGGLLIFTPLEFLGGLYDDEEPDS